MHSILSSCPINTTNLDVDRITMVALLLRERFEWMSIAKTSVRVPKPAMTVPYLTKSCYLAGLQCGQRLWRVVHQPHPYEAPAPGSTFDVGTEIGLKAHLLFPGGVVVSVEPWQHADAIAQRLRSWPIPRFQPYTAISAQSTNGRPKSRTLLASQTGADVPVWVVRGHAGV